jgi:hypothetical protein
MQWFPRSLCGAILAGLYVIVATTVVVLDRRESGGGNWITLRGLGAYLITFPISLAGERLGRRLDYRKNLDMAFAIGVCALLAYLLGAGLCKLVRLVLGTA